MTVDGAPRLHSVVGQLWGPLVSSGDYRVMVNARPDPHWVVEQRLWVVASAKAPLLLVSTGARRSTARSLTAYRGIRGPVPGIGRVAMAGLLAARLPIAADQMTLERCTDAPETDAEPLAQMSRVLGAPLVSIIGVRQGANAKATLQLFTTEGVPAGYAKTAWNNLTADFVSQETETLRALRGSTGGVQVPRVLEHGTLGDLPYLVTSPLPPDVTSVRGHLRFAELVAIAPLNRRDVVGSSLQFKALSHRVKKLEEQGLYPSLTSAASQLVRLLRASGSSIPIGERWHGDLVPWNAARQRNGTLWLWDWEMSEPDAALGLDALHWRLNTGDHDLPALLPGHLITAVTEGSAQLRALGLGRSQMQTVGALYALTLAERSMQFARQHDGWHLNRLQSSTADKLLQAGLYLATKAGSAR